MFFDDRYIDSKTSLRRSIGRTYLLSIYEDPSAFIGWGYPSTWKRSGKRGYRMMYQGWPYAGPSQNRVGLLADSDDGVHWYPAKTDIEKDAWPQNVSNAVYALPTLEQSCVFRDEEDGTFKILWKNASMSISPIEALNDGVNWDQFGNKTWTSSPVDPGIHLFLDPTSDSRRLVVTSKPQVVCMDMQFHTHTFLWKVV